MKQNISLQPGQAVASGVHPHGMLSCCGGMEQHGCFRGSLGDAGHTVPRTGRNRDTAEPREDKQLSKEWIRTKVFRLEISTPRPVIFRLLLSSAYKHHWDSSASLLLHQVIKEGGRRLVWFLREQLTE